MIRFRHHSALAVMALLALIGSGPFLFEGMMTLSNGEFTAKTLLILVPLAPLLAGIWAWRAGTDANEYGIRVRALLGRRVVPWAEISALTPDDRGRTLAVLLDGSALRLTAVKPADLPRLAAVRHRPEDATEPATTA